MAAVIDAVAYILRNHTPKRSDMYHRITRLVYLADWKHSLGFRQQITSVKWYRHTGGILVLDVEDAITGNPGLFLLDDEIGLYGVRKGYLLLRNLKFKPVITAEEKQSLDYAIKLTQELDAVCPFSQPPSFSPVYLRR